jgi:hypothetical protein
MNYQVTGVAMSNDGWGFSITDSGRKPLVHFEYEHQDKAKEAHRAISQTIGFAVKITPYT